MVLDWFRRLSQKRTTDWIACIDFGTAYSKAAMVLAENTTDLMADDIKPLPIGDGESRSDYLLPSLLFLTDEAVLFGKRADETAQRNERHGRSVFASPKQYLSTHAPEHLDEKLDSEIDPTGTYTARQLIALYLAYLLKRAEHAAEEIGLDWPPKLRIARPAWSKERAEWGEEILRHLVRQAFLLIEGLGDDLLAEQGVSHERVRAVFYEMPEPNLADDDDLFHLAADGTATVMEATAVATGSIRPTRRRIVVVADIGGGTSDFGAFMTGLPGHKVVSEIRGSSHVLRQAGDVLDMHVRRMMLSNAGLLQDDPAARGPAARLRGRQRNLKERLFQTGEVVEEIGDHFFSLKLDDFLSDPRVQDFAKRLNETFQQALDSAVLAAREFPSQGKVTIEFMATGGGASLPMVQDMMRQAKTDWPTKMVEPELF
ncbi:MAG: hypothetical protein AAFO63_11460, partial [Pseudomonadota bacterium]